MLASVESKLSGSEVSSPTVSTVDWTEAKVPTTVLAALVNAGVYPDPYVGLNNMRIPDASNRFNTRHDLLAYSHIPGKNPWSSSYWFRTEFDIPDSFEQKEIWLNLDGINYRAEIWINGIRIATRKDVVGMFGQFRFRVTDYINDDRENVLAIEIFPPDAPGMPAPPQLEPLGPFGANGGDCRLAQSVTMQASQGWDWIPAVRDRNTGIWQSVWLEATGPVVLDRPGIITDLPLPDTSSVDISMEVRLANVSKSVQNGRLNVSFFRAEAKESTPVVTLSRSVVIDSMVVATIELDSSIEPDLHWQNPALWWPNGYGRPSLYRAEIDFVLEDGTRSHTLVEQFGIREFETTAERIDGDFRRDFYINGVRLEFRGGAWVPDMLLHWDEHRFADEARLSRHANMNMIRIWGGGVTPPDAFFDATDKEGLLVWHDFWITGDCQATWSNGSKRWPIDSDTFLDNARDVVYRLRNRASHLVWTGGNEGYARREIYTPLRNDIVRDLDGTRPFLPNSSRPLPPKYWGWSLPDNEPAGVYSGGPYHFVPPDDYFKRSTEDPDWLFKDEVGLPSLPEYESLVSFMQDTTHVDSSVPFPLNAEWAYHDAASGNGKYELYQQSIDETYGNSTSLNEYARKGQLVNYDSYRALFEAVNENLDRTAGVLLWKTNSAWPSVMWQLYDWYLRPNAGYYAARDASEKLHVQWNPKTREVFIINREWQSAANVRVDAQWMSPAMEITGQVSAIVSAPASSATRAFLMDPPVSTEETGSFLVLKAFVGDSLVSENLYWVSVNGIAQYPGTLATAAPEVVVESVDFKEGDVRINVTVSNPSDLLSYFNRFRILANGTEILPAYWSKNYLSLFPGESRKITVSFDAARFGTSDLAIETSGWNTPKASHPLPDLSK